jgi:hypothetical protein
MMEEAVGLSYDRLLMNEYMIYLKYKCKVNFVKLPLIWTDLCLKLVFENV